MKRIFSAVVLVGILSVTGSVSATDTASRYRGTTAEEFQIFQEKNQQLSPRSSIFSRRLPDSMRRGLPTSKTTQTVRRTGIGLRANNEKIVVSTQRDTLKQVSIPSIQFWAELPDGFVPQPTTISWTRGSAKFVRGDEWVELSATGQLCDGGSSYAQTCLQYFADDARDALQKKLPGARTIKNERVVRDGVYSAGFFQKSNAGWWFLQEDGDSRDGVLTFFDPINEYVWYLRIHSSGEAGKFLADARNWKLLFQSLFEDPTILKNTPRNTIDYVRGGAEE